MERFPCAEFPFFRWQKEARFQSRKLASTANLNRKDQMPLKSKYRLHESAQMTEERLLRRSKPMPDVADLKRTLREGLTAFEAFLRKLPPQEQEEAIIAYLEKVRKVTYSFHFVVVERAGIAKFNKTSNT